MRVRDNHRKALQRRRTKSGQAAKKIKPAKYEQELTFLVPYLSDGDIRQSNFSQSEDHKNTPSEIEEEQDENEEADELSPTTALPIPSTTISSGVSTDRAPALASFSNKDSFTPSLSPTSNYSSVSTSSSVRNARTSYGLKPRNRSGYPPVKTVATVLERYLTEKKSGQSNGGDSEEALTTFFMSMAKTVKGFPVRDQIEVKKKLFQVVSDKDMEIAFRSSEPVLQYSSLNSATQHATHIEPNIIIPQEEQNYGLPSPSQPTIVNSNYNSYGKEPTNVGESFYDL